MTSNSKWYEASRDWGVLRSFNLDHLHHMKMSYESNPAKFTEFSLDHDRLMGLAIPPFQRPIVWDEDRMIAFIETLAQKGDPGTYTYHVNDKLVTDETGRQHYPMDMWLLDGQQRITSINRFFDDEFPVFGLFWSEIEESRRRGFLFSVTFPAYEVKNKTELELRELYDLKNFSGVPHQEHERAVRPGMKP